jgi:hypothetical protein
MEEKIQENQEIPESKTRQAIRPLLFAAVASGVAVFLLSPGGLIHSRLGLDLSFLIAAFVGYYAFRFLSKLCHILLPSYYGLAASHVFSGLAFSFFFYHVLARAVLLTRLPGLEESGWFFTALSTTAGYVVLFIAGCVLSKLARVFSGLPLGRQLYPAGNALGQLLVGLSMWQFLACFSDFWDPMNRIGLMLFAGMLAVSSSNIGAWGARPKNPFIRDVSRWFGQSPDAKFILGALIAAYLVFIRPAIVRAFYHAPLIEWGLVCFIAWRLFEGIKSGLATDCAVPLQDAEWRKHLQQVANRQDRDFKDRTSMQRAFVTHGHRDALLEYLTLVLDENRLPAGERSRVLRPLVDHEDVKTPWFLFRWQRRRRLRRNERERQRVLDQIMEGLKDIASPVHQRTKERNYGPYELA